MAFTPISNATSQIGLWTTTTSSESALQTHASTSSPGSISTDLNPQDPADEPLRTAIALNDEPAALRYIQTSSPKELHIQNKYGHTPLHFAILMSRKKVALALIEKLPTELLSIQYPDNKDTLLHYAVANAFQPDEIGILFSLIKKLPHEALNLQNIFLYTPLELAILYRHETIALLLIETLSPDELCSPNDPFPTLFSAIKYGVEIVAQALIEKLSVNALGFVNEWGDTALHYAITSQRETIALAILKKLMANLPRQTVINALSSPNRIGYTSFRLSIEFSLQTVSSTIMNSLYPQAVSARSSCSSKTALPSSSQPK